MMSHFAVERTWGAEPLAAGGARFRLWAPAIDTLTLLAVPSGEQIAMTRLADGWFEVETDLVAPGDCYMYLLPNGMRVPDPAAREQRRDVHGPSRLIDPLAYSWRSAAWKGRPWDAAVIYELHTGTFSAEGTFEGLERKLDHLVKLGVTIVELMPVAQFSGNRGWGYDGVLLYAPHVAYGGTEALKRLIDAAHERGLMVFLDVVYNHFGPDGNYLHTYAPDFFNPQRQTPWGVGIAYDRDPVRKFFIENALYWLEEFRFDGLRLDAIDQIRDDSTPTLLEEIASSVHGRITDRIVHLTTEDDRNATAHLERTGGKPRLYTAEWNDDVHHAAHVIATGDTDGYYRDYSGDPFAKLARALAEGFIYQGEPSPFRDGAKRGEPSGHLPPLAFIDFLQNHDQIGNRAFGERLTDLTSAEEVRALLAVLLLSPHVPLLFMGEEWGETRPFCFFTDFQGDLARQVREGRRNEFQRWRSFADPENRERIPDPNALSTFEISKIDWGLMAQPEHGARLEFVRRLLEVRRREIVPRLAKIAGNAGSVIAAGDGGLAVSWKVEDGSQLVMAAGLHGDPWTAPPALVDEVGASTHLIYETADGAYSGLSSGSLPPWSVVLMLKDAQ